MSWTTKDEITYKIALIIFIGMILGLIGCVFYGLVIFSDAGAFIAYLFGLFIAIIGLKNWKK